MIKVGQIRLTESALEQTNKSNSRATFFMDTLYAELAAGFHS